MGMASWLKARRSLHRTTLAQYGTKILHEQIRDMTCTVSRPASAALLEGQPTVGGSVAGKMRNTAALQALRTWSILGWFRRIVGDGH